MASALINTIIYSNLAAISTIFGILIVLYAKKFTKKYSIYLVSFAAGVLISFALMHLIPDALKIYDDALIIVLLGFLAFYLIEHFIMRHSFYESYERKHVTVGKVAILGLGLHSLIDGVLIAAGFEISQEFGLMATFAVVAHELPEGITSMAVLLHSKLKKNLALFYSFLVAIATPLGAVLTLLFLKNINQEFLGILIALAAGSFIYVGASDLVPETHERYNKINALFIIIGIAFVILIRFIFKI